MPLTLKNNLQIGGEGVILRHADAWNELCDRSGVAPFHRPEWILSYLRCFERDPQIALLTVTSAEKLVGVLPLLSKRSWYAGVPVTVLSGPANAHSVRFDLITAPDVSPEAVGALMWAQLKQTQGWDILALPVFPERGACDRMIALAATEKYHTLKFLFQECPVLHLQANSQGKLDPLAGTSRHFRHELRRFARLLEEETGYPPRLVCHNEPDAPSMERFYQLEAAGWKGEEGSAIACNPQTRRFYDTIAEEGSRRGYFCLHTLETNGTLAAAAFSVKTDRCFSPMKIAYNEALRRGGPGQLLFNGILQECAERQIPEFFFGGTKDRYKTSWTEETLPHFNGFIFRPTARGGLAYHSRTKILSPLGRLRRRIKTWNEARGTKQQRKPEPDQKRTA